MAMTIMNNPSAMLTLGELSKNVHILSKQLKKVSTGMKINNAGDDTSGYAISEKMKTRLRSLDQDIRNTQTGSSLLRVADGAVANIIEELRSLKELALNAANDTNTDLDRATIQKEVDNRLANIDDIAVETNYNGKRLLDGSIRGPRKRVEIAAPEKPTEFFDMGRLNGEPINIDKDGIYNLRFCRPSEINITAQNVVITGMPTLTVPIVCHSPNTNLWLQNVEIQSGLDQSLIQFSGGDNTLTFSGTYNKLIRDTCMNPRTGASNHALINVGGGLTIFGETESSRLYLSDTSHQSGTSGHVFTPPRTEEINAPLIGLDAGERNSKAYLTIASGHIFVENRLEAIVKMDESITYNDTAVNSALIGAGANGAFGDIQLLGGDVSAQMLWTAVTEGNSFDGRTVHYGETEPLPPAIHLHKGVKFYGTPLSPEPFHGLRIHTGTRANENLAVTIESMKTEDIGISDLEVVTQKKATAALDVIDSAIDYVLDQATHIGAYISRLEFTEANLVTSSESTQASESTIRDADMAAEMTEYTKANVLLQAAQSMLAQANQNSSQVMSLLQ